MTMILEKNQMIDNNNEYSGQGSTGTPHRESYGTALPSHTVPRCEQKIPGAGGTT
jgi:hypothetical protein